MLEHLTSNLEYVYGVLEFQCLGLENMYGKLEY